VKNTDETLALMRQGYTLHSGNFGFFLKPPVHGHSWDVHLAASRSLVKKKLIKRVPGTDIWELTTSGIAKAYNQE
jgi:hypothetical protein